MQPLLTQFKRIVFKLKCCYSTSADAYVRQLQSDRKVYNNLTVNLAELEQAVTLANSRLTNFKSRT